MNETSQMRLAIVKGRLDEPGRSEAATGMVPLLWYSISFLP